MTSSFELVAVRADEVKALRDLAEETFLAAFAAVNTPENIAAYVSKVFTLAHVTSEYNNPESRFYFIKNKEEVAGYLKLNMGDAQSEQSLSDAVEIERLYIRQAFQGAGLGAATMAKAVQMATELGMKWLWLGVWDQNDRAIALYEREGFVAFDQHDFYLGAELQQDILMRLPLVSQTAAPA